MKLRNKKTTKRILWLFVAVLTVPILILGAMNPTNVCQTSPAHSEPRLRSLNISKPPGEVVKLIAATIPTLRTYGRHWKLGAVNTAQDGKTIITVHAEVPVIIFTDDLVVTLQEENGGTLLNIRSASRIGKGDFGENRRHVLQLLDALHQKL